ncbi:MAG TPA: undecaprenyl-phosphate galactose phosphotransferase WbaP [Anaerolineales bacterium]|nr:undecaprenyl-phosphate galactose phosphotransferase WbaP [Anaerolineales bacterium]
MEETLGTDFVLERSLTLNDARRRLAGASIRRRNARLWMCVVLGAADMLGLSGSIALALQLNRVQGFLQDPYYEGMLALLAVLLVVAFYRRHLYPAVGLHYVQELRDLVSSISFAFLILIGITFALKTSSIYSRLTILVVWGLCLILIPTARYLLRRLCIHLKLWGEPVAIIGDGFQEAELARYFNENLQLGLRPVPTRRYQRFAHGSNTRGSLLTVDQIRRFVRDESISTGLVIVTDLNHIDALVNRYRPLFQRVILIKGRNGSYSLNSLQSLDLSGVLGLQVMNNLLSPWPQFWKRLADITLSTLGLAFLALPFGIAALLIRITSPGGVYFRQKVLGRDGRPFEMLKFRTMYSNAAQLLIDMVQRDPEVRREWEAYQKLRHDPRITPVGRLLRKFSLDELPQLWNVLHGQMSLVGPRPMMTSQRGTYGEAFDDYVQVAPGMTGLWQVSGRNETTFARRAELDREYIQRWSAWLDMFILLKTVKIVFWHKGAY